MEVNIEEMERQYQILVGDFQAGKIDESTFIAEIDRLQFQDDWGRYWMMGSQTGAWHYYDGQNWHQADPHDRDKLPFVDDQGRYWQKGSRSGDWYYYQPETGEWVKPGQDDPSGPTMAQPGQWQGASAAAQPAYGYEQAQPDPYAAAQSETQLFQDDEGRYWAMGTKTGQWYFYDENGWHPAHDFQGGARQPPYQPQPQAYAPPPQQPQAPYYQQQPYPDLQAYGPPPQQPQQPSAPPQPAQGTEAERQQPPIEEQPDEQQAEATKAGPMPQPPQGASQSGGWYYFDGKQWLKYSTGEPAEETPPDPKMILEQESEKGETAASGSEPVVAEFFEEDEPPVEVVDVEVITVVEAEPEEEEQPEPETPEPKAASRPVESSREAGEPVTPPSDQVIPRRSRPAAADTPKAAGPPDEPDSEADRQPKKRAPTEPGHPVKPRKRATPHEPTIIIPTGSTVSGISSSATSARSRRPGQPMQPEQQRSQPDRQRRAREDTLPMQPFPPAGGAKAEPPPSDRTRHRQVTQQLPKIPAGAINRAKTDENKIAQRAKQPTQENIPVQKAASAPSSAGQATRPMQPEKKGYTFGDVLRSLPSTMWTLAAGVVVLFIFAFLFIVVTSLFSDNPFGLSGVSAVQSPTPTLDTQLAPDSTPTPGPTPTEAVASLSTPTPVSMATFSSSALGFTLEYPENWQTSEDDLQAIFAPSPEGLDPNALKDTSFRIGTPQDETAAISELLTNVLSQFPSEAEILNEGTISIASQTWTSTLISFENENLGGQGYATIAVTNKDGTGYYLVAIAPAEEWNTVQPLFQGVINSFRFGAESVVAQTESTPGSPAGADSQVEATDTPVPEQTPTPAPDSIKPVIHVIESGDTLLAVAAEYGVDADLLASENNISDPQSLRIGQELVIPYTAEQAAEFYASGGVTAAGATGNDEESTEETSQEDTTTGQAAPAQEAETEAAAAEATEPEDAEEEAGSPAAPLSGRIIYPGYNPGTNTFDLWILDVATGEQTAFAGNASQPAFNKDGSLLAYRSWDLGTRGIFFKDFAGGRGGKVTNFVEDAMPSWSPDGFTFVFSSRKEGDRVPRLYIGNQLGEDPVGLSFQGEYPSVMPDGRIVAKGCTPSGDCGIFVMGPRGGGETKIADDPGDTAPAPSPDGNKIAFMSIGRGGNNWEIWVMNSDGSNPQRLTENNNNDGLPTWSPDGQSIAYVSDQGGVWSIWVMNADGSNQRKLADMKGSPDGIVLHDEPNSKGWLEERISWAP